MNEKTKKILSYIACALGGMALGIALLGGLAMCSTSTEAEAVNTLTKTKKNAVGTTDGGFTSYTFSVDLNFPTETGTANVTYYQYENSTGSIVTDLLTDTYTLSSTADVYTAIESVQNEWTITSSTIYFAVCCGRSSFWSVDRYWVYWTFLNCTTAGSLQYYSYARGYRPISSDVTSGYAVCGTDENNGTFTPLAVTSTSTLWDFSIFAYNNYLAFFLNEASSVTAPSYITFQDVESYYKELGYQAGYSAGYTDGESAGYSSGYADGYAEGSADGYTEGYEDGWDGGYLEGSTAGYDNGYTEGESAGYNTGLTDGLAYGQEFTTYQVMTQDNNGGTYWPSYGWTINENAESGMYGEQSSSTYQIANLLQYKTEDDDLHLIYLILPIEDNDYFGHVYIYVYNQTDSTLEDTIAYGLRYYQTAADYYGWDYAYMFWTSGGTRTIDYGKVTAIYNNSLQLGYIQLSGLVYQETIYNVGYQAGLLAGQTDSNMNNVFSLFTTAFDAVGGFFELQVFGFLPLYWFFIAPLFIALITLILRMVKH